eukprot:CAMPEP_0118932680 /NCGR_PEP_ID=MMETSP1169-20130426/10564_1 /TAXON_ID=36882 /ORGANISM="Pyramimonas obovata, Strain CCMP722" /LENGTH=257 /DNA_ID=CAMNT_0006875375 /DNA_START=49 /DNA_END=818 /DNA_ORIENTATION=-
MASISSLSKMEMSLEDVIKMSKKTKEVAAKKEAPAKKAAPQGAKKGNSDKKGKKPATPAKKAQGGKPVAIAAFKGKGGKATPVKKGKGVMQGALKNNKQAIAKAATAKASASRQAKLAQKRGLGANAQAAAKKRAQQVVVPTNLRNQNGRAPAAQGRKRAPARAAPAQARQPQKTVVKRPVTLPKAPVSKNMQIHITNNAPKKGGQQVAKPKPNIGLRGFGRNNRSPVVKAVVVKQPKKQIVKPLVGGNRKGLGGGG